MLQENRVFQACAKCCPKGTQGEDVMAVWTALLLRLDGVGYEGGLITGPLNKSSPA